MGTMLMIIYLGYHTRGGATARHERPLVVLTLPMARWTISYS